MEIYQRSSWLLLLLGISFLATTLQGVQGEVESEGPSESECRPYIEKALKELETGEAVPPVISSEGDSKEDIPTVEITTDDSDHEHVAGESESEVGDGKNENEDEATNVQESVESEGDDVKDKESAEKQSTEEAEDEQKGQSHEETGSLESQENEETLEQKAESIEASKEAEGESTEQDGTEEKQDEEKEGKASTEEIEENETKEESAEAAAESAEESTETQDKEQAESVEEQVEGDQASKEEGPTEETESIETQGETESKEVAESIESQEDHQSVETLDDKEAESRSIEEEDKTKEEASGEVRAKREIQDDDNKSMEDGAQSAEDGIQSAEDEARSVEDGAKSAEDDAKSAEDGSKSAEDSAKSAEDGAESAEDPGQSVEDGAHAEEDAQSAQVVEEDKSTADQSAEAEATSTEASKDDEDKKEEVQAPEVEEPETEAAESAEVSPEEELSVDIEIPSDLRPRDHVLQLLKLDGESEETEKIVDRISEITLRELKRLHENAITPLETLYKYRDLSNRHFGDAEIFSKPLVLFMGPWSGGKSSIINYLLDNEYNDTSLRTGAEPSPAYFNILMHGKEPEVLDGTQLAADFTFSGLQKFGQGLEERLRGLKLPNKLLEKINIVEIPGILEVRKQVSRVFPFNDACQWFIDRADIIFLVYDPSKLDVGPETEAILDQLKGREYQTRIVLNKADQVKPEELMRVQGALIWNISPLMSSAQPPVMYTTSLWSRPYESWAPTRLLQAQERAFLRDLRTAIDKRIENKISSARRFAVRVRNHAKMVDCYLTTYYNHKSVFGNKKLVSDQIIEHPQDYHIYEGLSTLTNISRYDLPDPEVYRGFFKLNPLYDFQQLSATCTYFRGCPINRLDIAIAYDLPELVGKHKKLVEAALAEHQAQNPGS